MSNSLPTRADLEQAKIDLEFIRKVIAGGISEVISGPDGQQVNSVARAISLIENASSYLTKVAYEADVSLERELEALNKIATLDIRWAEQHLVSTGAAVEPHEEELLTYATFTRASTGTYFGADGLLRTQVANKARVQYNPDTREIDGLLIEPQRTNGLLYSNDFSNGVWFPQSIVTVSQDQTGIDGQTSAWTFTEVDGTGNFPRFIQQIAINDGEARCDFVIVKRPETNGRNIRLRALGTSGGNPGYGVIFDLVTGTGVTEQLFGTGATLIDSGVIPLSNNFLLCYISGTLGAGQIGVAFEVNTANDTANSIIVDGDSTKSLIVYAAQSTEGTFPTSYIETLGSAVARAEDQLVIPLQNIVNFEEGTILVEFRQTPNLNFPGKFNSLRCDLLDDTGFESKLRLFLQNNTDGITTIAAFLFQLNDSVTNIFAIKTLPADFGPQTLALSYKKGEVYRVSINGSTAGIGNLGNLPVCDLEPDKFKRIRIDSSDSYGTVPRVKYIPKFLTQEQLNALTA